MLGPKQDQQVQGDGTAIQATGDVHVEKHYHGLQVSEVRELTEIFLERQLPLLRAEAVKVMQENTQAFVELVVSRLAQSEKITQEAFSKPDAQVCFNEALKGSAEKGDQIDLDMLADMVIGRLEADDDPLMKLVHEDAVKVLPRLTSEQIAFLSMLVWMRNINHREMTTLPDLELFTATALPVFQNGLNISTSNREYLSSLGLITINHVADTDSSIHILKTRYPFLPSTKEEIALQLPSVLKVIDAWGKNRFSTCFLNATGLLIGLLALKRAYGPINLSSFIR